VLLIGLFRLSIGVNVMVMHRLARVLPLLRSCRGLVPRLGADVLRLASQAPFPPIATG